MAEPGLATAQRLQGDLRERVEDVRWARAETLHLTVHFFGQLEDERASTALEVVTPIAGRAVAFEVVMNSLGAFPERGSPRVLWAGPSHDVAPLTALALECRGALGNAGFDVEDRRYHAHCTLGRPRLPWISSARAAWSAAAAGDIEIRFTASRMVLYESRSAPGGAVYVERASLPFVSG